MPEVGDPRPWVDPISIATKGRKTTYSNGTLRSGIDSTAIQTQGRVTTYFSEEIPSFNIEYINLDLNSIRSNLSLDSQRLDYLSLDSQRLDLDLKT